MGTLVSDSRQRLCYGTGTVDEQAETSVQRPTLSLPAPFPSLPRPEDLVLLRSRAVRYIRCSSRRTIFSSLRLTPAETRRVRAKPAISTAPLRPLGGQELSLRAPPAFHPRVARQHRPDERARAKRS